MSSLLVTRRPPVGRSRLSVGAGRRRSTWFCDSDRARAAGSKLIGRYIDSVRVESDVIWQHGPFIALKQPEWHEVQILKEVMRKFIITRPDIAPRGEENRCILDYICTLTDGQCYALYYKLDGAKPATSAMDFFS